MNSPSIHLHALHQQLPSIVKQAGDSARFAWEEFFYGRIRSEHTRRAYYRAVVRFMTWCEGQQIGLRQITPAHVGVYLTQLNIATASKKQVLAALRHFFDGMTTRHAVALNPALSVRTERYSVLEGKTPEITVKQVRHLLQSIDTVKLVGLRDKCIIAILVYTAVRIGAVAKLRCHDFYDAGDQHFLHFVDKGGKSREIPVRHDLQILLLDYLQHSECDTTTIASALFKTAHRHAKQLSELAMTENDIGRMVKRRIKIAGLPSHLSAHSFRVATITDLLSQGVPLEDVQNLAGHADPRTTRLYDRRQRKITRNIVERISV